MRSPGLNKAGLKPKQMLPVWTKTGFVGAADNSRQASTEASLWTHLSHTNPAVHFVVLNHISL